MKKKSKNVLYAAAVIGSVAAGVGAGLYLAYRRGLFDRVLPPSKGSGVYIARSTGEPVFHTSSFSGVTEDGELCFTEPVTAGSVAYTVDESGPERQVAVSTLTGDPLGHVREDESGELIYEIDPEKVDLIPEKALEADAAAPEEAAEAEAEAPEEAAGPETAE